MSVRERITPELIARYQELVKPKKKLRKKGSRPMVIFFVICVIIGAMIGGGFPILMEKGIIKFDIQLPFRVKKQFAFIYPIVFVLFYYVCTVLHTIIHEGGHLIFGLLTGYRFLSFRVLSFTIVKKDGKLMRKKLKVPGTLGQCLMMPPEWKEDEPYPYVWYNLGGGLLNLVFCLLAIPLFFLHSPLAAWSAGFFMFCGLLFVITNLIPMSIGLPNDGKNCLFCAKDRENQKAFYAQLKINLMLSDGVSVADLPEDLLCVGEGKPMNPLTCFPCLMKFYQHLAFGEEEQADACLARAEAYIEELPVAFVNAIDLERLYMLLLQEGSVEEIAAYYAVMQPVFLQVTDISVLRIKYAYYLLLSDEEREMMEWLVRSKKGKLPKRLLKQKKPVTAEKVYEAMEKAYEKHPVIGEAEFHMNVVKELMVETTPKLSETENVAEPDCTQE